MDVLAVVEAALVAHFGQQPSRASVSFVGVEPIGVLRFEPIPGERAYLSLGMARAAMSAADAMVLADNGPRAELMLHVRDERDEHADVWRRLAVLAAAPAVEGVVYRADMTVELGVPLSVGSSCTGVLVTASAIEPVAIEPAGVESAAVESAGVESAGVVDVLQAIPATANELAWARVHGGAALRACWADQGTDLLDLTRAAVTLERPG